MLKRHQVLLEDWQVDYIQNIARIYDISLSEALRIIFSIGTLCAISMLHPEYKSGATKEKIKLAMKECASDKIPAAKKHSWVSSLYFEGRKAVEYRLAKLKKQIKETVC
ncbi:MAG: hypothetical protein PHJ00_01135 [Candidatus Omnitrophica bacterium]|nr:hypothetical protein [Candidatus Omnitrophota bacterium]MDD5655450.1 hypothetical protein [Candidatus Omnitrophota bacterium]